MPPADARAISAFVDHLLLERRLSPHTAAAYRADLASLAVFLNRGDDGATYRATWPAIITEQEHYQVQALFASREREPSGRRYLLTGGIAVCGLCETPLVARPKADGRRCYVCARDGGGCGKIRVLAAPLEELVAEAASAQWDRTEDADAPEVRRDQAAELQAELDADQAALEDLARARFAVRSLSEAEFRAARDPLVERIAQTMQRLEAVAGGPRRAYLRTLEAGDEETPPWAVPPGEDPDQESLEAWRQFVSEVIGQVRVGSAVRGRNTFDPSRVEIVSNVLPAS